MARVHTYCRICEAACGLLAELDDAGELTRLIPDADHPASRGYACIKGPAFLDVHRDPDRLARPQKREGNTWRDVTWPSAVREIGERVRAIRAQHGPHAVAVYIGNPTAFSWGLSVYGTGFLAGLGTRNFFNASTLDCQNKFAVTERMYGSYVIQPIPDLDHTSFFLGLGTNPLVSQMSLVAMPRPVERLRGIVQRGGRVVHVNPRRTETAEVVGEHVPIRPDTDVFLLMGVLRVILDEKVERGSALAHAHGLDRVRAAAARFDLDDVAAATGIARGTIVQLARDFAAAPRAVAYCSTGVNQGSAGTLAFWAVQVLNAITGNLDAEGGSRVPARALHLARLARGLERLRPSAPSRIGGFPQVATSLPTGLLADEILTPGEGQVRALFVLAGNPMLSAPGGERLARALSSLDLLVSIDLYRNETGALGHYALPTTDFLERADFPLLQVAMQPEPYAQLSEAVARRRDERRTEAEILLDLAQASGLRMFGLPGASAFLRRVGERRLMSLLARALGVHTKPGPARPLDDEPAGRFLSRVPTSDGRIDLAPADVLAQVEAQAARCRREAADPPALRLIGRRQKRSHNSWMHNVERLRPSGAECKLAIHPDDARARGIADGARVLLSSRAGALEVQAEHDGALMPGTVSLPHGWGHTANAGWRRAAAAGDSGVNVNALAEDGPGALEPLSGMARLTGIEVEVRPV